MLDGDPSAALDQAPSSAQLARLVRAVQDLSRARSLPDVQRVVGTAARDLSGADGATFVLRDGDQVHYAEEDAIGPLWKGRRFPIDDCISGWSMKHGSAVVIEDVRLDSRIPQDAYRPTYLRRPSPTPRRSRWSTLNC
jgi:GAF domain-containing protein